MAAQAPWLEKDYYRVLGVPEGASQDEITRAYRRLARQLHPDANPDQPDAEERFKEVSAAYDVVGDPEKRKEYDELRRLGPTAAGFGSAEEPDGFSIRIEDLSDLGDLGGFGNLSGLGDLFGDLFGSTAGREARRRPAARRGADLEAELQLSFEDAARGITTPLEVFGEVPCDNCGGRGAVGDGRCPACGGRGARPGSRQVKVRVPAGVEEGQRLRLAGRGSPGREGGPPGDLYVTVRVAPHRLFGRKGPDLTLTVPITFAEAALGAEIKVPTLEGETVTVRIPPGTPSGRTFRVRGRGVASKRGRGDLLVTVEVAVPRRLSAAEREAVEALARTGQESPRAHLGV